MTETEEARFRTLRAVIVLLGDYQLQQGLRDEEHFQEVLQKIGMPETCRGELLNLLERVAFLAENKNDGGEIHSEEQPKNEDKGKEEKYEKMQLEAFDHIRTSFWVALSMSIALFIIGVILMGI